MKALQKRLRTFPLQPCCDTKNMSMKLGAGAIRSTVILALAVLLFPVRAELQARQEKASHEQHDALQKIVAGLSFPFLQGFNKALSGETIVYHSAVESA